MPLISLIVLSKTDNETVFKMNLDCFTSFIESVEKAKFDYEIILVESHKKPNVAYNIDQLKIITPDKDFNFHGFLNIGIENAKGSLYVLSNNDVIYSENWLVELNKVRSKNKNILSYSPYDSKSNKLPKQVIEAHDMVLGYDIQKHLTGWCIIADKKVFEHINKLDERFDFYYADYDYALCLQKYNLHHALVTNSKVQHLENTGNKTIKPIDFDKIDIRTPKYVINENWTWVLQDENMIDGLIKYHEKWGSRRTLKMKLIITEQFSKFGLGYFNRFIL